DGVQVSDRQGGPEQAAAVEFTARDGDGALDRALELLREGQSRIDSIAHESPALEEIFERIVAGPVATTSSIPALAAQSLQAASATQPSQPDLASRGALAAQPLQPDLASRGALRQSPLRIAQAFLKRDLLTEASYRFSFLLQFLNTFFSAAVFYFISRLLGPAAAPYLAAYGGDYFSFVLIGIAFAGYFGVGLSSFANNLRQAQTTGTLEAMLATPTGLSAIILSSSLWDFLLTTLRVVVYLALGAGLMGVNLGRGNYPAAALILLLTVTVFSSLGIMAASFIMVLKRGDPITWAFNALFSLLGGVYYPITVLPGWMQTLSGLIPMTYALRAMRLALLQGASLASLAPDLLALAGFSLVLLPASLLAFRFAVRRAKVDGSLAHY
ncbi:MAG TPA: ABC transporter permease, partial [Anaerolineales bacterium]